MLLEYKDEDNCHFPRPPLPSNRVTLSSGDLSFASIVDHEEIMFPLDFLL